MKITIDGELCDLNNYIKTLNYNRFAGASLKKSQTEYVCWQCKKEPRGKIKNYPVTIKIKWFSKNKKKDIDNISFGKKFIMDGLVMAGIIENDSRKFIKGFQEEFFIDVKKPRVEIEI